MYKFLLCWRYLKTRYLALACIISVMLGVATLIVVNSVMSGFSTKLKQRLHGLLSDVVIKSYLQDGFADPQEKIERIRKSPIGDKVEAVTPSIEILGLIQMKYNGQWMPPRAVHLMGVEPEGRTKLGGFSEFLTEQRNSPNPSFEMSPAAKRWHELNYPPVADLQSMPATRRPGQPPPPVMEVHETKTQAGLIPGYAIGHYRSGVASVETDEKDVPVLRPGDEVIVYTISGQRVSPVYDSLVVVDFFKSEMSDYDANYVFVPLEWLQRLRAMDDRATSLQIKLRDFADAPEVVRGLKQLFPSDYGYFVDTWEDEQGPLLAAIRIEKGLLNVLLFLIIGVAGFGILAIFAMIVTEKTRDIGILKALGASNGGVMKIFLGYGLLLGVVGAVLGTALGLTLTININPIEHQLGEWTGMEIFPRTVYYFDKIPTDIQAWSVSLVNVGAVAIAVIFSVLPALRAALLRPVQALRYE